MILIQHHKGKISSITDAAGHIVLHAKNSLAQTLFDLSKKYHDIHIGWCDSDCAAHFNTELPEYIRNSKNTIASYHPGKANFLPDAIGYVEESVFINVNKGVTYPTWQMSGKAGVAHASVWRSLDGKVAIDRDFDYFLNSIAKLAMPLGLFCYSEPKLVRESAPEAKRATAAQLFRFVKQHYKTVWVWLLLLDLILYDRKFPVFAALTSLFYKRRKLPDVYFETESKSLENRTLDVVIPTIGRGKFLYDFLKDLSAQTLRPEKVIIVEQNPEPGSRTALAYLTEENWPFRIKHIFTHQPGVCNARNLALAEIESGWVFFADDDIRIAPDFIEQAFGKMGSVRQQVFNFACLQKGQKKPFSHVHQTSIFGSGCSIISRESLGESRYDTAFEFGFGEDHDFAKNLIDKGYDICYLPEPEILHLKAPVGGFRKKPELAWDNDEIQPKPSPTVMLYRKMHQTREQLLGYKTILFLKMYRGHPVKNPVAYLRIVRKQWNRSFFWANKLAEKRKS